MSDTERRAWSGRVKATDHAAGGVEIERTIIVRELPGGARRVIIPNVGECEVVLQPGGKFENQPFAVGAPNHQPELHRLSGQIESMGGATHGRFRVTRDGTETASGSFEVKLRKGPKPD